MGIKAVVRHGRSGEAAAGDKRQWVTAGALDRNDDDTATSSATPSDALGQVPPVQIGATEAGSRLDAARPNGMYSSACRALIGPFRTYL